MKVQKITMAVAVLATALAFPAAAQASTGRGPVKVAAYDLGDGAFQDPAVPGPIELAAVVHYPARLGSTPRPLIVQLHGSWWTCADRRAEADLRAAEQRHDETAARQAREALGGWPCRPGVPPLPSERGYDYLGDQLARAGFVVVSLRANGINAAGTGLDAYGARARLINKHLAMWRDLSATGTGDLAGKLVDPATGRPDPIDFRGRVDMTDVGTMGHSRGGKAVMWQASDKHRAEWPAGVRIRAVFALAPVYFHYPEEDIGDDLVTTIPFTVLTGSCDGAVGTVGTGYVKDARGKNPGPLEAISLHGANHNFYNTQWSLGGGQVMAEDDALREPGTPTGRCHGIGADKDTDRQLTEERQRRLASKYIIAFFGHRL
ncbi:hypothetical protein [Amycolatopsis sp. CA-230715]|uniref:hypothetical protein n=1 Tax=Amycolatopsis sp. CA-230715 TaxID=2745196 RepID=UPI001C027633|nr:hypothetical protein [Amycolatopsis sp. CA-230715]